MKPWTGSPHNDYPGRWGHDKLARKVTAALRHINRYGISSTGDPSLVYLYADALPTASAGSGRHARPVGFGEHYSPGPSVFWPDQRRLRRSGSRTVTPSGPREPGPAASEAVDMAS